MFLRVRSKSTESETKFQEIINELKAYIRQKQLVPHMKKRLLAYYHYRFKNSYFREKQILSNLSGENNTSNVKVRTRDRDNPDNETSFLQKRYARRSRSSPAGD